MNAVGAVDGDAADGDLRGLQLLAQPIGGGLGFEPQRVVGLHAQHQVHAALEVETELHLLVGRIERPDRQADDAENDEDFPTNVLRHDLSVRRFNDGRLSLIADDGGPGHVDAHVRGNLQLDGIVADLGDRAEEAARGDDLVADLQRGEEVLDLLLPVLHRQQDHEIEDGEDERERNELDQRADLLTVTRRQTPEAFRKGDPSWS